MPSPNYTDLESDEQFAKIFDPSSSTVYAFNFWASWAPPCTQMNEIFEELATKNPAIRFIKIEAEKFPDISEEYEIAAVPSFVIVKEGEVVDRVDGANPPELSKTIAKHSKTPSSPLPGHSSSTAVSNSALPSVTPSTLSPEEMNARLKELTSSSSVMVFIKGTPTAPRCQFSRQLLEILTAQNIRFSSFNILADDEVRQAMKAFSDWPTFPQVYVKGEFVGGLDVVKEMVATGEFQALVPAEKDLKTRMDELINKAPLMIFIKGSPETPRCGFSKKLVALLADQGVTYDSFDILEDDDIRQGLKTHVDWPTFPMVFFKGELLGGLDIITEMIDNGEFAQVVVEAKSPSA
ncbi:Glutaredoxin 3 [Lobosporangium transversale]|uniref:Putative thioredoxin-like protein n=1 Tax=Lobosporangium transversale TaxID=64571 RepID=A0A1Y2GYC0_9FUNG|nr:putative thioredoxin-like protein [Lobosporangium transversale]KAF9913796.1 Glutaredoxin 3 [Lobosporangium transversale]ORZ26473.1 putative thioredoxin-like protein [Lobosporangium transversale]|eukprot:XP_021884238.1 putative thioredoxin-like protein [Lobosporangium transversale]